MTDFPAAHSMDTTWFAIDADGCVGIFDSSEGGAIPNDLTKRTENLIEYATELIAVFAEEKGSLLNRDFIDIESICQLISVDCLTMEICRHENLFKGCLDPDRFPMQELFLEISTATLVSEVEKQVEIVIELARKGDRTILYVDRCNLSWLKNAIISGLVLAGSKRIDLQYHLNLLGVYVYDCDKQYPDPYYRQKSPKKAILLQDLPDKIIQNIQVTELPNLRFAETEAIQPIEHLPCSTWKMTDCWEGTDGEWHEGFPDYSAPTATDLI